MLIETAVFTRRISELMNDDQYAELQGTLADRPDARDLIPSSCGLRKLRWRSSGRGKRSGARIIYYWYVQGEELRMLYAYEKARQEDLTREQLARLRETIERWDDG